MTKRHKKALQPLDPSLEDLLYIPEILFQEGACIGSDPKLFDAESFATIQAAKLICANCPVIDICRDWGVRFEEGAIYGGLTPGERAKLRGGRPVEDPAEIREIAEFQRRLFAESAETLAVEFGVSVRTIHRWRAELTPPEAG